VEEDDGHGQGPLEERKQAKQARREESARKRHERQEPAAGTTWPPALGVAVRDGNIYQHGVDQHGMHSSPREAAERAGRAEMTLLGPLAGAHAEVGGGRAGRRRSGGQIAADTAFNTLMLRPAGLLFLLSRKGFEVFAVVSFAPAAAVVDRRVRIADIADQRRAGRPALPGPKPPSGS